MPLKTGGERALIKTADFKRKKKTKEEN